MKKILIQAALLLGLDANAQNIDMYFPQYAGKTYEFVLFQGKNPIVINDTIPQSGRFTLQVPDEIAPFTGMCRWLITNTQEGGGLDMHIPGKDFSVSCTVQNPAEGDVIYKGNNFVQNINTFHKEQQYILNRYKVIEQGVMLYGDKKQPGKAFKKEYNKLVSEFSELKKKIERKDGYVNQFMDIVLITRGEAPKLGLDEKEKNAFVAHYIANKLDWDILYTSGHWSTVIGAWADIHHFILNDAELQNTQLIAILTKLNPQQIESFNSTLKWKNESYLQ